MAAAPPFPPPASSGIHQNLSPLRLRGTLMKHSRFIHFGDLPEYLQSARAVAAWKLLPFYERMPEIAPKTGRVLLPSTVTG